MYSNVCSKREEVNHFEELGTRFKWKESVKIFPKSIGYMGDRGSTVGKVLCYKSEGRWFDPNWCQRIFH